MPTNVFLGRLIDAVRNFDQAVKDANGGRPVERTAHGSNLGRYETLKPWDLRLHTESIEAVQTAYSSYKAAVERDECEQSNWESA